MTTVKQDRKAANHDAAKIAELEKAAFAARPAFTLDSVEVFKDKINALKKAAVSFNTLSSYLIRQVVHDSVDSFKAVIHENGGSISSDELITFPLPSRLALIAQDPELPPAIRKRICNLSASFLPWIQFKDGITTYRNPEKARNYQEGDSHLWGKIYERVDKMEQAFENSRLNFFLSVEEDKIEADKRKEKAAAAAKTRAENAAKKAVTATEQFASKREIDDFSAMSKHRMPQGIRTLCARVDWESITPEQEETLFGLLKTFPVRADMSPEIAKA
jgi:hypothetical protein